MPGGRVTSQWYSVTIGVCRTATAISPASSIGACNNNIRARPAIPTTVGTNVGLTIP